MEPRTAAGRALWDKIAPAPATDAQELHRRSGVHRRFAFGDDILAIEAEARKEVYALIPLEREAATLDAYRTARAAVEAAPLGLYDRDRVLAAIDALIEGVERG